MKFSMFSASFEARSLLASFYIVSRIFEFVKNFFSFFRSVFSVRFLVSLRFFFVPACLSDSLIILSNIRPLVNAFFYLFLSFFTAFFAPLFICAFHLVSCVISSRWQPLFCVLTSVLSFFVHSIESLIFLAHISKTKFSNFSYAASQSIHP